MAIHNAVSGLLRAPPDDSTRQHYFVLDLMRGIAALAVLIWHYQHFFITQAGNDMAPALRQSQPLYTLLWPFYEHGALAVEFFWLVSGFVFASVYIAHHTTTREFIANRFARLYPLHLLTLLVVAALQITSMALLGHWEIYLHNDVHHFVLNLFMTSNWITAGTYSFNGPIWSVSIEILVYVLFWMTLSLLYRRGVAGPMCLVAMFWLLGFVGHSAASTVLQCGFYFFVGVTCFLLARLPFWSERVQITVILLLASFGIVAARMIPHHSLSVTAPLLLTGLLLAAVALERPGVQRIAQSVRWIGDNTYGTYLWHVPIQIAISIALDYCVGSRTATYNPWFLLAFVTIVIIIARGSFVLIESPARAMLRRTGIG